MGCARRLGPARCTAVANLCVPYLSRGFALPILASLVDRSTYPETAYPLGQWDYWSFYRERFAEAARQFEADPAATIAALYRRGSADALGKPARTAGIRAAGGWFGGGVPDVPRDETMLDGADFDAIVDAFRITGFHGANAWYMNDEVNIAHAARAPLFGRIDLPALFLHSAWDTTCETVRSRLAEPMRSDCTDLRETTVEGGHSLMLERPVEVCAALADWLARIGLAPC